MLSSANAWSGCSPIVLDLGNDGIHLGDAGVGVYFDINADGVRDHVQWVRRGGDEGFLALDRNGNGVVDDGSELFGVGTPLILEGRSAPNGFVGLAQYDSAPARRQRRRTHHRCRRDLAAAAHLGGCQRRRRLHLHPRCTRCKSYGITALETIPNASASTSTPAGNVIPLLGLGCRRARPGHVLMVDVFFRQLPKVSGP